MSNRSGEPVATHYRTNEVETIKFENLLMVEQREKDGRVPLVNDSELQHVREGRLDRIAEEQMKIDRQKDEELRKQEEQLRLEEEAYYAAKRKAAKKTKQPITVQPSSSSQQIEARKKQQSLPSNLPGIAVGTPVQQSFYIVCKDAICKCRFYYRHVSLYILKLQERYG